MGTPLHLKPPMAAWIVRERHRLGLKPRDVAARLAAMGLDVTEATVKVWESNADRRPNPYNLEGLERIFDSKAPAAEDPASGGADLAGAIRMLVDELRAMREERELVEVRLRTLEAQVALLGRSAVEGSPERSVPHG